MPVKYIHTSTTHNSTDPEIIVPIISDALHPKTVVDFGCGIGNFLGVFKNYGAQEVLGLDGSWARTEKLTANLTANEFKEADLEKEVVLDHSFDLAICLEVAEHLAEDSADILVSNLTRASQCILFSAAIPAQGGQNHINEQWLSYWTAKFKTQGFIAHDVIRPLIWHHDKLQWWYKQNIVLLTHESVTHLAKSFDLKDVPVRDLVHPELFKDKQDKLSAFKNGDAGVSTYARLLLKSISNKFKK